ncbi:hypothetical protein EPHNCH_1208 [Anaplasma phagocytophilum str. NCH-1]|uniref:Uncharacterized protein n=1 Tax=Anaplasma phagocytophilum str. NCH-1 TaxID=1359161 RepID=A0A0F3N4R7_ANAPH|nr:hypothetical protein EPHNCH_1208 [Anaplasma phagocytophilum str. NCH-1]
MCAAIDIHISPSSSWKKATCRDLHTVMYGIASIYRIAH